VHPRVEMKPKLQNYLRLAEQSALKPSPSVCARLFSLSPMNRVGQQVEKNGYGVVSACVSEDTIRALVRTVDVRAHGVRNLLANPLIRNFAASEEVKTLVTSVLGTQCFAVRGIFFNKNPRANWKVVWHQDCVIAVRERVDVEGWGPWSIKAGVTHVRPAAQILDRMVAIRIHLDDCGHDNGPLRVIPGSHRQGFLSDKQIQDLPKDNAVSCLVYRGDAILMRPLLLHASSPALHPSNRRVIHLEFSADELPSGLAWHDRVALQIVPSPDGVFWPML
jgi:hypothetical protein